MPTRHEIYFAVGKYSDPRIHDITCCENDVTNLANAFKQVFFEESGSPIQTIVSTHPYPEEASKIGILRAFESATSCVQEEDTLIVTFSGHGAFYREESYWLPHDAIVGAFDSMIPFSWVKTILDKVKCKFCVVLIDACHSGDASPLFKNAQSNFSFSESSASVKSLISSSRGLAYGTACTFSEFAYVSPDGRSSMWIDSLVEFINSLNSKKPLFVDELLLYSAITTAERVRVLCDRTQTPFRVIKAAGVLPLGFKQP